MHRQADSGPRATQWPAHLFAALILVITAGGLAFRLPKLDQRPMHCDEAVHAYKLDQLLQTGEYRYDPAEYHGPTLYYLTLPVLWLNGVADLGDMTATMVRLVPVLFGVGLVALLLLIGDGLGRWAAVCAGVLTAVSPAMVYYSRYYVQETLLVFFTFALIACGWRYVRSRHVGWALFAGAAAGLMHATKETSLIAFGALLAALALNTVWHWRLTGLRAVFRGYLGPEAISAALLLGVLVSVALYSGMFQDARGPLDSLRTYATYFDRAGGHGVHDHPWYYYLGMLVYTHDAPGPTWSEGLILGLAAVGALAALLGRGVRDAHVPLLRFLTIYTVLMTVVYSAIPYKTPWCLLGFLHGMILLAGVGASALMTWLRRAPLRVAAGCLLLAGAGQLGYQAYVTNYRSPFFADARNPYAYAYTRLDLPRLPAWLARLAAFQPADEPFVIKVITPNAWPLPWYLRGFDQVGYWEEPPDDPDATIVIVSSDLQAAVQERLRNEYWHPSAYGFRPDATLWVYVERGLWGRFERSFDEPASSRTAKSEE